MCEKREEDLYSRRELLASMDDLFTAEDKELVAGYASLAASLEAEQDLSVERLALSPHNTDVL